MTNLSYDPNGLSGVANVPMTVSTAGVYQGSTDVNISSPESGQVYAVNLPLVLTSGIQANSLGSGNNFQGPSGAVLQFPGSGSILFVVGGAAPSSGMVFVGGSGGGSGNIMVGASGYPLTGSGGTVFAAGSGIFTPAGFFFIQVPTSGTPTVKVPFFNS